VAGTATGATHVDGITTTVLKVMVGATTMFDDGIETTTPDGMKVGTCSAEITTTDGADPVNQIDDGGSPVNSDNHEIGTATGEVHEAGTTTTVGTETHDEAGTVTTALDGTGTIKVSGTETGTLV